MQNEKCKRETHRIREILWCWIASFVTFAPLSVFLCASVSLAQRVVLGCLEYLDFCGVADGFGQFAAQLGHALPQLCALIGVYVFALESLCSRLHLSDDLLLA